MKLIFETRGCAYFKVRELDHIKFQDFVFVLFNSQNGTQNLKTKKTKKKQKEKHQNIKISTIASFFNCF